MIPGFQKAPIWSLYPSLLVLLNFPLPLWLFIFLISILIPTALLICIENTFWTPIIRKNLKFLDLFKQSFTFYVESRTKEMAEAEIDILCDQLKGGQVTEEFKAMFCKIVIEHLLCRFHCFYLHSTYLTLQLSSFWNWIGTKEWKKNHLAAKIDAKYS